MGQEPEAIRDEIEETRGRMTETVDALGYKADVKARAGDYVSDKKDALSGRVQGVAEAADSLVSRVTGAVPDPRGARDGVQAAGDRTRRATSAAQSNPLGLAVGAMAAGFLIGMMLPSTRIENERMGEIADDVKARVKDTGEQAIEHGKEVAQETAQAAMSGARDAAQTAIETARESGQEHAEDLKETAQSHVEDVRGSTGGSSTGGSTSPGSISDGVGELEEHGPVGGPAPVRPDYR
jgi:gas vesicle protein